MNGYPVAIGQRRRIRESTYQGIARWAAHAEVSVEQLKLARKEIALDLSATNPISEMLKYNYVIVKNELESEDGSKTLYPEWNRFPQYGVMGAAWERWNFWTIGEPEVSLRLTRQVLVNQLPQSDKLPWDRPPMVRREYPTLFEVTTNDSKQLGQLSPTQLAKLIQDPIGQRLAQAGLFSAITSGDVSGLDSFTYSARTSGFMIDVVLAAHEYQREFGEFPVLLEELIPNYLDKIPLDEFDSERLTIRAIPSCDLSTMSANSAATSIDRPVLQAFHHFCRRHQGLQRNAFSLATRIADPLGREIRGSSRSITSNNTR